MKCIFYSVLVCLLYFLPQNSVEGHTKVSAAQYPVRPDTAQLRIWIADGRALLYNEPDSALLLLKKATALADSLQRTAQKSESMAWSGVAYYVMGEYDQAMAMFIEARRLAESCQNHNGLATSLNGIGLIYQTQRLYQRAISNHKAAIVHALIIKNVERVTANRFNIGLAYDELGHYDSALYYLHGSLELARENKLHRLLLMSINRMAKVRLHLKDYDRADSLYQVALRDNTIDDNWEKCFSLAGLAEVSDAQGRYATGIEHGQKSLALAKKMHAKWDVIHAAEILTKLYEHQRSFENAYEMSKTARLYKDSVFNDEKEHKLSYIELKESELSKARLEHENVIQVAQIRQKNAQISIAVIVAVALLIVVFVVYSRQRHKALLSKQLLMINQMMERQHIMVEKQNKELLELNHTKNSLLSIISHDMRGPFNTLHGMLDLLRMGGLDEGQQQMVLKDLSESFRSVSGTLEGLLQWAHSQMHGLGAKPQLIYADEVIDKAIHFWESSAFKKSIQCSHTRRSLHVFADAQKIETVVRNIVGNAIKFTPSQGSITIDSIQRDGKTGIVVSDTGIGMTREMVHEIFTFQRGNHREGTLREKGSGLGLMISHQLALTNGGNIEVSSEEGKGSTFIIWLPSSATDTAHGDHLSGGS